MLLLFLFLYCTTVCCWWSRPWTRSHIISMKWDAGRYPVICCGPSCSCTVSQCVVDDPGLALTHISSQWNGMLVGILWYVVVPPVPVLYHSVLLMIQALHSLTYHLNEMGCWSVSCDMLWSLLFLYCITVCCWWSRPCTRSHIISMKWDAGRYPVICCDHSLLFLYCITVCCWWSRPCTHSHIISMKWDAGRYPVICCGPSCSCTVSQRVVDDPGLALAHISSQWNGMLVGILWYVVVPLVPVVYHSVLLMIQALHSLTYHLNEMGCWSVSCDMLWSLLFLYCITVCCWWSRPCSRSHIYLSQWNGMLVGILWYVVVPPVPVLYHSVLLMIQALHSLTYHLNEMGCWSVSCDMLWFLLLLYCITVCCWWSRPWTRSHITSMKWDSGRYPISQAYTESFNSSNSMVVIFGISYELNYDYETETPSSNVIAFLSIMLEFR